MPRAADLEANPLWSIRARNILLLGEAEGIAVALDSARIPAIFLKGVALLESYYEDPGDRSMADLDLLVKARDLPVVIATLTSAGYQVRRNALVLCKKSGPVNVQIDLHHELLIFRSDDFWSRCEAVPDCPAMRILGPEDLLLHCSWHAIAQDGATSPQAIRDGNKILNSGRREFQWELFWKIAQSEGWRALVRSYLTALGIVPQSTQSDNPSLGYNLFRGVSNDPSRRHPYLRILGFQEQWSRRIEIALRLLFPPLPFLRLRYSKTPRIFQFLLPVLRPFFLLADWFGLGISLLSNP